MRSLRNLYTTTPETRRARSRAKNIDLDDLVNDLLKQEIRIAESLR